jgi:hypothetical protein
MTSNIDMGRIPQFNWKGQTFNQITSKIKRNQNNNSSSSTDLYFRAQPLTIYRRELVTNDSSNCNMRTSASIDLFDRPNGSIVNSKANHISDVLENTLDIQLTTNKTENFDCNSQTSCFNPVKNALRKLRSGGMIKRQFDITKNNDTYAVSTSQYLVSRNRTFQQNQYNYIRQGNAMIKPGDALSVQNVYSAQGLNHCQKHFIPVDTSFQYQWIDGNNYTVTIPSGFYTLEDINIKFQFTMSQNYHYYVSKMTKSAIYLMNIAYNSYYNTIEIQVKNTSVNYFSPFNYSMPLDPAKGDGSIITTWKTPGIDMVNPNPNLPLVVATLYPVVIINNNLFKDIIGFNAGRYPNYEIRKNLNNTLYQVELTRTMEINTALFNSGDVNNNSNLSLSEFTDILQLESFRFGISNYSINLSQETQDSLLEQFEEPSMSLSQFLSLNIITYVLPELRYNPSITSSVHRPMVQPLYVPIYYKPNNPGFAQQGGVSCSTSTLKTKYDTVTNNASIFTKAYGLAVGNEMAYGVPPGGYTVKDKTGFPIKSTPRFSKVDGSLMVCQSKKC